MTPRLNYAMAYPEGIQAFLNLGRVVEGSGLELSLVDLVKIRASQINGCSYCIDMHTSDARAAGESEQRINALSAWRESLYFTPRERAALAWTEATHQYPAESRISPGIQTGVRPGIRRSPRRI